MERSAPAALPDYTRQNGVITAMSDEIRVEGVEFRGRHGVEPAEQVLGNRFRVDLVLELDLRPAGQSDDLSHTVNYADAARIVVEIGTGPSVQLIETLAERIAAALLSEFPLLQAVTVSVAKLHPAAPTPFAAGVVRIRRIQGAP